MIRISPSWHREVTFYMGDLCLLGRRSRMERGQSDLLAFAVKSNFFGLRYSICQIAIRWRSMSWTLSGEYIVWITACIKLAFTCSTSKISCQGIQFSKIFETGTIYCPGIKSCILENSLGPIRLVTEEGMKMRVEEKNWDLFLFFLVPHPLLPKTHSNRDGKKGRK